MGYPMRSGYRSQATPASEPGLSNAFERIDSLLDMIKPALEKLPANDLAKLPLKRWFRFLPWLRPFMNALQAYELYRSAMNLSSYDQTCTGAATTCEIEMEGLYPIPGTPTCVGTFNPRGLFFGNLSLMMHPGGIVQIGKFTGNGPAGCGVLRNQEGQRTGYKLNAARPFVAPFLFNPWPRRHLGVEVPWADPWDLPISTPTPRFPPLPWITTPYRARPWSDPSPVPGPDPRVPPVPTPDPWPDPGPRPRPRPDPKPKPKPDPDPKDPPVEPLPPVLRPPPVPLRPPPRGRVDILDPILRVRQSASPVHRPPGRRTVESKLQDKTGRIAWLLAHAVTESKDVLEGMWKALPENMRSKQKKAKGLGKHGDRRTPPVGKMFKEVYSGIRKLNEYDENHLFAQKVGYSETDQYWSRALDEVAANLFQDYVFGKLGQAVARESAKSGRPIGFAAGPAL